MNLKNLFYREEKYDYATTLLVIYKFKQALCQNSNGHGPHVSNLLISLHLDKLCVNLFNADLGL